MRPAHVPADAPAGLDRNAADVVLIVDDVPDNLSVLHDALDEAGYTVLVATHGEAALQRASQAQPECAAWTATQRELARQFQFEAMSRALSASCSTARLSGTSSTISTRSLLAPCSRSVLASGVVSMGLVLQAALTAAASARLMASNWNWRARMRCASVQARHSGSSVSISSSWFMMPRK